MNNFNVDRYQYKTTITIPEHDCDPFLRLKPQAMLVYFQNVAGGHLETLDLPYHKLFQEGFVFLVAGIAVKVYRSPMAMETVNIHTAPLFGSSGVHMLRETVITDESHNLLAECQTNWALLDSNSQKLLRAKSFPYELPTLKGEWTPFFDPSKIRIKPVVEKTHERVARLSDLDRNMHMNNTIYASVLLDCFGEEYLNSGGLDTMMLRFHQQARMGDVISLGYGKDENNTFTLGATLNEKHCFEGACTFKGC